MYKLFTLLLIPLAGCASMGNQGMSAAELKAVAADKNFSAVCSTMQGVWGSGKIVYVNVDRSVVINGQITVSPDCVVTMSNEATVKPTASQPTPVVVPITIQPQLVK